ncbi:MULTISPECIES: SA0632 family lipoprotein [Staphylococcus]|uniref:Lipoprotein n=1 Tax=Staphylococcus hsinchuensis TaxID=3051183 RepID=A0ABZ3EF35_9STAP|nr:MULTISPECIES: hypothetical protein [unclassified Staphylococcus]
MKKYVTLFLAATIVLSGCGKSQEKEDLKNNIKKYEDKNKKLKKQKDQLDKENKELKKKSKDLEKEVNADS